MLFAWITSFIYGATAIVLKLTSKHTVSNPWFSNFIWHVFILAGTVPIALSYGAGMPQAWSSVIIAGFLSATTATLYILALSKLDVSVISPLYNFRSAFTALMGAAFLGEILTSNQYFLIITIILAGIFLNIDERFRLDAFFQKKTMLGILAVFVSAMYGFSIKTSVAQNGFWETSLWMPIIAMAFLLITIPLFYKEVRTIPIKSYIGPTIAGLLSAVGDLTANMAYSWNVTISSAIISLPLSMVIAFLFSIFAPQLLEKHSLKVYAIRFAAAGVMFYAAIQLSLKLT